MLTPIAAVTAGDPYPYYADLVARRPFGYDEGLRLWVAADAASVTAVLSDPALRVRPPAEPVPAGIVGTPAGEVFGDLVRMTDGDRQQRLKRIIVHALGQVSPEVVTARAVQRTADILKAADRVPLPELMFEVPAQVVADLCGLPEASVADAGRLVGDFVQCIPATATTDQYRLAATAAGQLQAMLDPQLDERGDGLLAELVRTAADGRQERPALLANGIGLLSQTYDATAGLVGNTLLALARVQGPYPGSTEELALFVREVARWDAPIQNTRRFAAEPTRVAGTEVQPGQAVLVVLAAANRDPAVNPEPDRFRTDPALFTFGAAAHRCPGETAAVAIAAGVVGTLLAHGFDLGQLPSQPAYRPLPNARIPVL